MASDDEQQPPLEGERDVEEQRAAPRFTLLIRAAKLVIDDSYECLCIIRDASDIGVRVRLFTPLPDAFDSICVEMSNGDRYPVEGVWQEGDYVGFRFIDPIDVRCLLDEDRSLNTKREVRLRIALDAILHSGGAAVCVAFKDISPQGASIESDKWLMINELVRIESAIMPAIYAKVRWREHPHYGLLFEQTFQLAELAQITAPLQPGAIAAMQDARSL